MPSRILSRAIHSRWPFPHALRFLLIGAVSLALWPAPAKPSDAAVQGRSDAGIATPSHDSLLPLQIGTETPPNAPLAQEGPPLPLPRLCDGVTAPGGSKPSCCVYGYVWDGETVVAGATVTLTSASGSLALTTASGPDSGDAYYRAALSTLPLNVFAGDSFTVTASYSSKTVSRTWIAVADGQQVDVGLATGAPPQPSVPTKLVAQIGGMSLGVAVQGSYAYVGAGPRLRTLDITDPTSPTLSSETGVLSGVVEDLVVSGPYAYVAAGIAGLRIMSLADSAHPQEVGHLDLPGYPTGVYVAGTYAYVACEGAGVQIVSIAAPSQPAVIGSYYPPDSALGVFVSGSYMYVAGGGSGLRIVSVANPTNPVEVGAFDTAAQAENVFVDGAYAFVADGDDGLRVISVSNVSSPSEVGAYDTSGYAKDILVSGSRAYVADRWGGLSILSIASPSSPTRLGGCATPDNADDVVVSGSYAYIADNARGLRVASVADPANPQEVGAYEKLGGAGMVALAGSYAYVSAGLAGLWVLSVANPSHPVVVGKYESFWEGISVFVAGSYAYVPAWGNGLRIISISDPTHPVEVAVLDTPGLAAHVVVSDGYAYVADRDAGLRVISVSDPLHPTEVGACDTPGLAVKVAISGTYAYVADEEAGGLRIISIANPSSPVEIGHLDTPGQAQGLFLYGSYVYITDGEAGLRIVSVADPAHPQEVGSYATPFYVYSGSVVGSQAYLAEAWSGEEIISLANPLVPKRVALVDTPGYAWNVTVAGNYAYVGDGYGGLAILGSASYWTTKAPMPAPRESAAAVALDGKVYVIGGQDSGGALSSVLMYDPTADTWSSKASMPAAKSKPGAAVANGRIYVMGPPDAQVYEYNPATNTWATKASMPITPPNWVAVTTISGDIFVSFMTTPDNLTRLYRYDPFVDSWEQRSSHPDPRGMALGVANGMVYAVGGGIVGQTPMETDRVDRYDPTNDAWLREATPRLTTPRTHLHPTLPTVGGRMYVLGGWDGYTTLSSVEVYDPWSNTWSLETPMPTARYATAYAAVGNKIYVIGGNWGGSGGNRLATNEELTLPEPSGVERPIALVTDQAGYFEIYRVSPDGSQRQRVTNDPYAQWVPSWSPKDNRLAVADDRGGSFDIYTFSADGFDWQRVTADTRNEFKPAVSPHGQQVAFLREQSPDVKHIWVAASTGGSERQLTAGPGAEEERPAWSPDGQKIAFGSTRDGDWQIYTVNVDGSNLTKLTNIAGDGAQGPDWSPGGERIAFYSGDDIYIMNADGTNMQNVTRNHAQNYAPQWSPDGTQIAFLSTRDGHAQIYVMNSDGSNQHNISGNASNEWAPAWAKATAILAAFTASPLVGTAPLGVQFSDRSTGNIVAWEWLLGDGGRSGARHPVHTYQDAGSYSVSLTITGPGDSDTETKTNYVVVGCPPPVANFSASPLQGKAPLVVTFTDQSSGSISSWSWSFGDGATSLQRSPSHTYATAGTYNVTLTVSGPCGSNALTRSAYIQVAPEQAKSWTFMLYFAGDNDTSPYLERAIERMEQVPPRSNLNVLVLIDRWGEGDTRLYHMEYQPQAGIGTLPISNPWPGWNGYDELNTGTPATLQQFITWAQSHYPADHYFLSIADHGRGTSGIAWDEDANSHGDYLDSYTELGSVLSSVTGGGSSKIDVLMFDACLMGLLEVDYEVKDTVKYIVSSENLGWATFVYDRYMQAVGDSTEPAALAVAVAQAYFGATDQPRTIAVVDTSRLAAVGSAVDSFAQALSAQTSSGISRIKAVRDPVQVFDSYPPYERPDPLVDEYVDLYHLATLTKANFADNAALAAAAQGIMDAVSTAVLYQASQSGTDVWSHNYWALDNAHGIAIYFPSHSGGGDWERYIDEAEWAFTGLYNWDEFLLNYFAVTGLPPTSWQDPGYPSMRAGGSRAFLPVVIKNP